MYSQKIDMNNEYKYSYAHFAMPTCMMQTDVLFVRVL